MAVAIVTDSASSIPPTLAAERGITVVPLQVTVGDDAYLDGDITQAELLDRVRGGESATTAAPSPAAFRDALQEGLDRAGSVLALTLSASMSATHEAALKGATDLDGDIRIIDTRTAAGAQGLVVLRAAEAAATGAGLDEVTAVAEGVMRPVRLIATVGTLEFLVRSGRVPGIAGAVGSRLGVCPVFEFRDGKARPLWPSFSRESSVQRMLQSWRTSRVEGAELHVGALHSVAAEEADALLARVADEVAPASTFVGEFSTGMVVHTGPGILGLSWYWESPASG